MDIQFVHLSCFLSLAFVLAQILLAIDFALLSNLKLIHPLRKGIFILGMILFSQSVIWNTVNFVGGILVPGSRILGTIFNLWIYLIYLEVACAMAAGTFILSDCRVIASKVIINPDGKSGRLIKKLDITKSEHETYSICRISWEIARKLIWARIVFFPLKYAYKALAFIIRPVFRRTMREFKNRGWDIQLSVYVKKIPWASVMLAILLGILYLFWGQRHLVWFGVISGLIAALWLAHHFTPMYFYRCLDGTYRIFLRPGCPLERSAHSIGRLLNPLGTAVRTGFSNASVLFALAKKIKRGACPIVDF